MAKEYIVHRDTRSGEWITAEDAAADPDHSVAEVMHPGSLIVDKDSLAAAFTEWDRRYREEPERFKSEAEHLLRSTPESYGESCAPYLIALIKGDI